MRPSFPFDIKCGMLDVIVLIPDHCLSIYFTIINNNNKSNNDIIINTQVFIEHFCAGLHYIYSNTKQKNKNI